MAKILSKFGEQQLVKVNYACGINQSETGKYIECIIMHITIWLCLKRTGNYQIHKFDHGLDFPIMTGI